MRPQQTLRRRRALRMALVGVTATATALVPVLVQAGPASAGTLSVTPTGKILVRMRGNGHGHGMSQYGARGAAIAGKSARQIVAFYYPHTTLAKAAKQNIRVRLSGTGSTTTVAAYPHLTVTGFGGTLPTTGVSRYRLVAGAGSSLTLQQLRSARGSAWKTYRTGLPNKSQFRLTNYHSLRVYRTDGTSTFYFGYLRAIRSGSSVYTVDETNLDHYAAGVAPREMPASWQKAAVQAQSIAARTYGLYEKKHPMNANYDICDTDQCQVYGGHAHYSSGNRLLWTDDLPTATSTSFLVLTYRGQPIFSQFAASDGGWSTSGGQPYLTSHADPYDNAASGDPYLLYTERVTVASVARYFGLARLTTIVITKRDGHGWAGGRALAGYVKGADSKGRARTVRFGEFDLQYALGTGTNWLSLMRG